MHLNHWIHAAIFYHSDVEDYNPCLTYARRKGHDPGTCSADDFDNSTLVNCSRFVYDHSEVGRILQKYFLRMYFKLFCSPSSSETP